MIVAIHPSTDSQQKKATKITSSSQTVHTQVLTWETNLTHSPTGAITLIISGVNYNVHDATWYHMSSPLLRHRLVDILNAEPQSLEHRIPA